MYRQAWLLAGVLVGVDAVDEPGRLPHGVQRAVADPALGNVSWVLPCALACMRRTPNAKLFGVSILVFGALACSGNCPCGAAGAGIHHA